MRDTEPQTADGKVLWRFSMSLDGFVAGPDHAMDRMTGTSVRPGLDDEYIETTGAVLGGRDGFLTHHPDDATPADGVTFLNCDPAEAVRIRADGGRRQEP